MKFFSGLSRPPRDRRVLSRWQVYLLVPPLLGVISLALYAFALAGLKAFAAGLVTAMSAFVVGGFLGFLFAVPRSVPAGPTRAATPDGLLRSSTSLEEIADWLTKILVGLGLVELNKLVEEGSRLVDFIGPGLGPDVDSRRMVSLALLVLFTTSGFLLFYLATRVSLAPEFAHAEEQLRAKQAGVDSARDQLETLVGPGP